MQSRFILFWLVAFMTLPVVFATEQPKQMESSVEYDTEMTDQFFEVDTWSSPWWIIEQDDGSFEDTTGQITRREDIPRLRHTAECRTEHQIPHMIKFSEARQIDKDTIEIRIHDESASTFDDLTVIVRNGRYSSHYKTVYPVAAANTGLVWTTTKQRLVLNKKQYAKGDFIRGRIDFECVEEMKDARNGKKNIRTIRIEGRFKPTLQ
ncbi:MAG TPA: hypothetical protein DCS07_05095 [Bdellovibrionales bacterium]|nr:hypothetical protein [Bdellovibrionales bacterium]